MTENPTFLAYKRAAEAGKPVFDQVMKETENPMQIATACLMKILDDNKDTEYGRKYGFDKIKSVADYQKKIPVITYDDIAEPLERMMKGGKNILTAYQFDHMNETSGTIGAMKVVPMTNEQTQMFVKYNRMYTDGLMAKFLSPEWMQYRAFCTSEGNHRKLESGITVGCASSKMVDFIGGRDKADAFMRIMYTSPIDASAPLKGTDAKYLHARFFLEERNAGGIVSGFFSLVSLYLKYIADHYKTLIHDIRTGTISPHISIDDEAREAIMAKIHPNPERAAELEEIFKDGSDFPFIPKVWPNMQYVVGVGADGFASFDKTITERYGGGHLKRIYSGITASEGLFSVPVSTDNPDSVLAPGAGFMEFLPVDANDDFSKIVTMDALEEGKIYEIIYTNFSGFYRYRMSDAVMCTGHLNATPLVQFMYRVNRTVNLVCEKTTEKAIALSVEKAAEKNGIKLEGFNMYPNADVFPVRYDFLLETPNGETPDIPAEKIAKDIHDALCEYNAEYEDCANVDHTIGLPMVGWLEKGTNDNYIDLMAAKGKSPSQIKPARIITNELQRSFFYRMMKNDSNMNKALALEAVDRDQESIINIGDAIWDNPENKLHEEFASKLICDTLESHGFTIEKGICGISTAFKATYGNGMPKIGILAEFDALPGLSQQAGKTTRCPAKKNGLGHGCGHNLIAGGSVGAAIAMKEYLQEYPNRGTVVLYGCPDEEVTGTKTFMARDGAFDDLDLALCWHPSEINMVPFGITSAVLDVKYTFRGKASHAALFTGEVNNALDGAELMNIGVKYLRAQYPDVVNIGSSYGEAGEDAPNVIQEKATTHYCIRTRKLKDMKFFSERIHSISQGAALMSATKVEENIVGACSGFIPNREVASSVFSNFYKIGTPKYSEEDLASAKKMIDANGFSNRMSTYVIGLVDNHDIRKNLLHSQDWVLFKGIVPPTNYEVYNPTSTDVGDVSRICPVGQLNVASYAIGTPQHSWQLVSMGKSGVAHKAMLTAAKVLAGSAIDFFEKPAMVQRAKNDFEERTNGNKYHSLLPDKLKLPK